MKKIILITILFTGHKALAQNAAAGAASKGTVDVGKGKEVGINPNTAIYLAEEKVTVKPSTLPATPIVVPEMKDPVQQVPVKKPEPKPLPIENR